MCRSEAAAAGGGTVVEESGTEKKRDGLRLGGRYVRHTAAEKLDIMVKGARMAREQVS